ncbi:MAG: hypothetical protein HYT20_03175 [Candidatus Nealsonbacteria bacterium]|nr:hypothetical protein [Candidatus Nealsonbacteria bacterium]
MAAGGFLFFTGISSAQAALPTFVSCGAASGNANAITLALPASISTNDILLMFLETAAQTITVANQNGGTWTQVTNSPQNEGTNTSLTVFWSRYNGTQGNPVTSDSGDHQVGAICAYNGVVTSGDPWDVTSGDVDTTSDNSGSIPGATTSGPDRLVVIVGSADDDADTPITAVSNSDLANISTARVNAETNQGNDGGLTVFDGEKASAGSYGATTITYTAATTKGMMTIALKPPVTTIGNGTNPSSSSTAPGAVAVDLDSFTLQTNYCSQADPSSDTVSLTTCGIPVTTSQVQFKVRITPKSHANMPAPAGSTYSVTGTVTSFTSTNSQSGSDTNSATVTIDNASPANVTSASGTAGDAQVSLSWTNPADSDFHSSVVLRAASAVSDTPVEGATYLVGNTIGSATVVCVVASPTASCTNSGLTNGTAYHYKIFTKDTNANYSATGVVPTGSPFTPSTSIITSGNFSSATAATGIPTPSVAGSSESMTVSGLSASTLYYFAMKTSDEAPNTSDISNVISTTTSAAGTPEPTPTPATEAAPREVSTPARIIKVSFSGQAYPGAKIEVLRKDTSAEDARYLTIPLERHEVLSDGSFDLSPGALIVDVYFFALRAEDKDGRQTRILPFSVDLSATDKLEVKDILMPPTLDFERTRIRKGDSMRIIGYATPGDKTEIEIDGKIISVASPSKTGFYSFTTTTPNFSFGSHYARVRQVGSGGKTSNFSAARTFQISQLLVPRADFNQDNIINITDWSVFLSRWSSKDEKIRSTIDMNADGKIDIRDFSIFIGTLVSQIK